MKNTQASLTKILMGMALGLVIHGSNIPRAIAAEIKETTTKEVQEKTAPEVKETPSLEVKEDTSIEVKETPSLEVKENTAKEAKKDPSKDGYVTKAQTKEPDLFEVGDLPQPVVNSIIVASFIITVIGVLTGTGRSIKYDNQNHDRTSH
ncbi:MAG: hypothetical protein ACFBSE_12555 [Prochloraceae cyanobacterium]